MLRNTPVSDLSPLRSLTQLQVLGLVNTQVDTSEIERLQEARRALGLPRVRIRRN